MLRDEPATRAVEILPKLFLVRILFALLLPVATYEAHCQTRQPAAPATAPATVAIDSISMQVAEEIAILGVKPKTVETTNDQAMDAANALRRGDYKAAESLAREVLKRSRLRAFHFAPFNRFVNHLSQGNDADYLAGLNQWVAHEPKSALAHLMRAKYEYDTAWAIRGPDFAVAVTEAHWKDFREGLGHAEEDVRHSIDLDPGIPWTYYLWLNVAAGGGDKAHLDDVFRTSIVRFPKYYELYNTRLHFLEPKWGGSERAMYEFVTQYAGKAPESSSLKLLYLQLSANLLNAAWVDCHNLKHEALSACVQAAMNRNVTSDVTDGVAQAFALHKHTDPIEFNNAIWPILGSLESTKGDSTSINSILQLAAQAMGSDNQLIHESGHNNYVLDDITARIWSHLDNPANVDQKFHEALDDIQSTTFPNEEEKDEALGAVYEHMAWVARNASQYVRMIVYHEAANAVAGINRGGPQYFKCFAYFKLNRFQKAVDECTQLMDTHRDVATALYYRARAHEGLKQYDAAIADFAPIAENGSENYIRDGATIEMEHVMALQGNYQGELEVFRKYPFVFDPQLQPPDDLAIAYNNRCFAFMKIGQLEQALEDCTTSLKYGKLPDALQKQQQLLQQLHKSQTTYN